MNDLALSVAARTVDSRLDLSHRALVARAWRGAGADELAERAIVLAGSVLSGLVPRVVEGGFGAERLGGHWPTRYDRRSMPTRG